MRLRVVVVACVLLLGIAACALMVRGSGRTWVRQQPLANPIEVVRVEGGRLDLADGRVFRVAGVEPREGVDAEMFDRFLRAVTIQGVEVVRDVGDGSAVMLAEPRFHHWCGTCARRNRGHSVSCSLGVLAVIMGYASEGGGETLTARERWQLASAEALRDTTEPVRIGVRSESLEISAAAFTLKRFDEYAEAVVGRGPE